MPKPSSTSAKKNRPNKNKPKIKSASQHIALGDDAMQSLDIPTALQHYQAAIPLLEAIETTTTNQDLAHVLAKLGETKVSMGDQDGARDDFERAIALTPKGKVRAGLYLYVGQLSLEEEALEAYQKGITELEEALAALEDDDEVTMEGADDNDDDDSPVSLKQDLQQQLVRAHCTLAELYLTDLCFADNAEQECEAHVEKAMQLTETPLVDALQVKTSLRLSQQKEEEATQLILQAYQIIQEGCEELAKLVGLHVVNDDDTGEEGAVELTNVEAVNTLPGFEFRCQTSKLLMECASHNEDCIAAAIQVLGSLLAENDEVVEIWYLLGCAFELNSTTTTNELAVQYFQQALEMLQKVLEGLKQEDEDDDDVMQQLNECEGQIKDIQNKLQRLEEANVTKTDMDES